MGGLEEYSHIMTWLRLGLSHRRIIREEHCSFSTIQKAINWWFGESVFTDDAENYLRTNNTLNPTQRARLEALLLENPYYGLI